MNPYRSANLAANRKQSCIEPGLIRRCSRSKPKRSHTLRYVLRNRSTGDVYLVVVFTLHLKEDVNEDGTLKPTALQATVPRARDDSDQEAAAGTDEHEQPFDEKKAVDEARRRLSEVNLDVAGDEGVIVSAEDVD